MSSSKLEISKSIAFISVGISLFGLIWTPTVCAYGGCSGYRLLWPLLYLAGGPVSFLMWNKFKETKRDTYFWLSIASFVIQVLLYLYP
jgi:hypothetical protein